MSSARKFWSYQCEWHGCDKSFKSISTFEAHYRRHTDQRPYPCDYGSCTEAFHDCMALHRHRRTHANEQPFACKYESCGQTFRDGEALAQHYNTHTDQRPFACKYDSCGQVFHDRGKLTEHHHAHKERPLVCEYESCSRTFARRETLEAHLHMHTRERPFTCTYEGCEKSFCDRGGLVQHENSHYCNPLRRRGYESCNQTFTEPFQLHRHYGEAHEKKITLVEEVRPIRLRLSQPKKPSPESLQDSSGKRLVIRLPLKKVPGDTSTSDPREGHEAHQRCSASKIVAKRPSNRVERRIVPHDAGPSKSSSSTSSTSEASGKYQVSSSYGFKSTPTAMPHISTPSFQPQAPASLPTVKPTSAEQKDDRPCTDGQPRGYGTSGYTRFCGVYSKEKATPKKVKTLGGPYHCPRCDTQFTRADRVMRHFVGCITKCGNPDSLKWTDHTSLQGGAKFRARYGNQDREDGFLPRTPDVRRKEKKSRKLRKNVLLRSLIPKPLPSIAEENMESIEPLHKPPGRNALFQEDIVQPIHKRRDALRRSKYDPETIARDVLLATGGHPNMDPLNGHLDILRKRSRVVNLKSNMGTFRWDLVDPEQDPRRERQAEQEVEGERSAPNPSEAKGNIGTNTSNNVQWCYDARSFLPPASSTKPVTLYNEVQFTEVLPKITHFGSMSTIFATGFDCDPSARVMSSNGALWAAIFTMLERRYHEQNFVIRAAVRKYTGDVIGWVACHEVETLQAKPVNPSVYLDWTTAAHLLPSQISRFTATEESAEGKAERSKQREAGQGLASTIQVRAIEAQNYLVPIRRLVVNALVVHPLFQGRGIASGLLKSITQIADMEKRPVWVQAPEDPAIAQGVLKAGLFRRAGFTCAGELNLDLDSYTSGTPEHNGEKGVTFGSYKWNYMLRWPRPVVPKTVTAAAK